MKKSKQERRVGNFSIIIFLSSFLGLGVFAAMPGLLYGGLDKAWETFWSSRQYILWYLLYWAIITFLFTVFTNYQKYKAYDKPMQELSEAAEKVAAGDFSVYVNPTHTGNKANYIDYMIEDFNVMVKELGSLETLKTDFISNVSHELKTPLAVIQNYSDALKEENLEPAIQEEYIKTINTTAKNLAVLITNILNLNRLENQGIIPPSEPYDLVRQLADNLLAFDPQLTEKQLTVSFETEDRVMLHADEQMVQIIWRNLFSNAIKFTEPGGEIKVQQTSTEDMIKVVISDSGIGMDEVTQRRVFEKFYQGDTSHSREGNGLGMALVWRVVELLDGTISVKSAPGKGTAFIVQLPVYG